MTERLEWVEAAIGATANWIERAEAEARLELCFAAPGDWDWDYCLDQLDAVKRARETLAALRAEAELIRERDRWRQAASERGKYDDD